MTRNEFDRKFAAAADSMNYSADGDGWTAEQIAAMNDWVFERVADIDADNESATQIVSSYANQWVQMY